LPSDVLDDVAAELDSTAMVLAFGWLLQRSPTILPVPGTSSAAHLRENIAAARLKLSLEAIKEMDAIAV
jgi:pyridoxine 4-dehydrogenase